MLELIAILILFVSFINMVFIFYRKIPILIQFPKFVQTNKKDFLTKIKESFRNNEIFNLVSYEIFFQKILSKIRILILKIENKISNWLQNLRKRAQERKDKENKKEDNYWKEIKNNLKN